MRVTEDKNYSLWVIRMLRSEEEARPPEELQEEVKRAYIQS